MIRSLLTNTIQLQLFEQENVKKKFPVNHLQSVIRISVPILALIALDQKSKCQKEFWLGIAISFRSSVFDQPFVFGQILQFTKSRNVEI